MSDNKKPIKEDSSSMVMTEGGFSIDFLDDYAKAQAGTDGFMSVSYEGNKVYLRRLSDFRYQFIWVDKGGRTYCDNDCIDEWIRYSDLFNKGVKKVWEVSDAIKQSVANGSFPFLNIPDEYFTREIKFICEQASQGDVAYLNSVDGENRFFPKKEVYGIDDIVIISTMKIRYTLLSRKPMGLKMNIAIDGITYDAIWHRSEKKLLIGERGFGIKVGITDELNARLIQLLKE